MGTLANSKTPNNAEFHQGLHCLLKTKQPSVTKTHCNIEVFDL